MMLDHLDWFYLLDLLTLILVWGGALILIIWVIAHRRP